MSEQSQQPVVDPPQPWWRVMRRRVVRHVRWRLRLLWAGTGYRASMKLLHRFGMHYAPASTFLKNDGGWPLHRCDWCGLAGFVMPKLTPEERGAAIRIAALRASKAPAVRSEAEPVP